jgi:hypothetical protein
MQETNVVAISSQWRSLCYSIVRATAAIQTLQWLLPKAWR